MEDMRGDVSKGVGGDVGKGVDMGGAAIRACNKVFGVTVWATCISRLQLSLRK